MAPDFDERLLQRVQPAIRRQPLDGGDGLPDGFFDGRLAGLDGPAVDQHGADATLALAAAILRGQ